MASLKFVNTITGEQFEFPTDTSDDLVEAYRQAQSLEAAAKRAKDKARKLILERDLDGYISGNRKVKFSYVQRKNYDLEMMREVLDQDQFDTFIQPNKTALDEFIKENLESMPETKQLRDSMVDVGDAYITVRIDKI